MLLSLLIEIIPQLKYTRETHFRDLINKFVATTKVTTDTKKKTDIEELIISFHKAEGMFYFQMIF